MTQALSPLGLTESHLAKVVTVSPTVAPGIMVYYTIMAHPFTRA